MANQSTTRSRALSISLIALALILVGGAGVYQYAKAENYERQVTNQYTRAFQDLVDSVSNLDTTLAKGAVANSPAMLSDIANDVYRQATFAQANLGQLPIAHVELDNTAKFLSQVGDYTYSISKKVMSGGQITEAEYKQLADLSGYSATLLQNLQNMLSDLYAGNLSFSAIEQKSSQGAEGSFAGGMETVEHEFEEYPSLIYDGPFSDHINKMEAKHLRNATEITQEQALEKARTFLRNEHISNIEPSGESEGTIATYCFSGMGEDGTRMSIEVTKKDGYILFMLENRDVKSRAIDITQATKAGSDFLIGNGILGMRETYWEIQNNIATINYAYVQDGILMYPDLIKIKVAMDNGEIMGFESQGFLMAHEDTRVLPEITVSMEQARENLSKNLQIENYQLCVIPLDSGREALCHEFKGKCGDRTYLVYVNAATGAEERILMLQQTAEGTLTM